VGVPRSTKKAAGNTQTLVRITAYITHDQYQYLKNLRGQKISTSQYIRTAIEILRNAPAQQKSIYEFEIKAKKTVVTTGPPPGWDDVINELKTVLAKRRVD